MLKFCVNLKKKEEHNLISLAKLKINQYFTHIALE